MNQENWSTRITAMRKAGVQYWLLTPIPDVRSSTFYYVLTSTTVPRRPPGRCSVCSHLRPGQETVPSPKVVEFWNFCLGQLL